MPNRDSDDELKITRRLFLQQGAAVVGTSAVLYGVAMTTDSLARNASLLELRTGNEVEDGFPYPYAIATN